MVDLLTDVVEVRILEHSLGCRKSKSSHTLRMHARVHNAIVSHSRYYALSCMRHLYSHIGSVAKCMNEVVFLTGWRFSKVGQGPWKLVCELGIFLCV